MSERQTERRIVTALFLDVVGSAALTVQLGPERLKRALDRAFVELSAVIAAEGGTVEKYVGDAIHALFGAPAGHADDPQRALRAADACLRWAEAQTGPVAFAVRIGVETGEAIVDLAAAEGDRQQMSVGACVNLAARLQQLADPGQALVGPTCRMATSEVADFREPGEVELKGLGRVAVSQLRSVGAARPTARVPPFVGRQGELELLQVAYRRATSGRGVLALVSGPPGQGKTRLVAEFVVTVPAESRVLAARCRPGGELGMRHPLRELLAGDAGEPTVDDLAARLAEALPDPTERTRVVSALAHSAGLRASETLARLGPVERLDEVTDAWRRYLAALARSAPLVVWIEDVHWAEGELIRLLDRLTVGVGAPVLVLVTGRPEFAERAALRPSGDRFFVELAGLEPEAARALARDAGAIDDPRLARAEGNPLFIIELARSRPAGVDADLPLSLQAVIGARLDELPAQDRELLQRAAVAGETFTGRAAAALSGREPDEVSRALARLADLLYVQAVSGGYRFHHALFRDVAFGRLPTAQRMRLHRRYAELAVAPGDVEALAHHLWEAAGPDDAEWVWEDPGELAALRARAFEAHVAATRRCAERFAYDRALETGRRARRLAGGAAPAAVAERAIAAAHAARGDADEAWEHYACARELCRQAATALPAETYANLLELAVYNFGMFRRQLEPDLLDTLIEEGEAAGRHSGDAASLARLLAVRSYRSDDLGPLHEGLRLFEQAADPVPFAPFLQQAAVRQTRLGDFAAAEDTFRRLDALAAASGRVDPSGALEHRGILLLAIGDVRRADAVADELVRVNATRGPHLQTHALREKLHALIARGCWREVLQVTDEVQRLVDRHPGTSFCYAVTTAWAFAAAALALEGRLDDARTLVTRAEAPLHAPPFDRESVLLLAYGVVGRARDVERLRQTVPAGGAFGRWFFLRMEAVVLTMLQQWDALEEVLPALDAAASRGSRYLPALAAAVREERAAAHGRGTPRHAELLELGQPGWSQLLRYRPPAG